MTTSNLGTSIMELGFQLLASMIGGWLLGQWLSGGHWWAGLLGGFVGFIGAMYQMYRQSIVDIEAAKQAREAKKNNDAKNV